MLVIARRVGEEIVIDGNVRITVLGTRGSQVRLGILAPPSVAVLRREVFDRKVKPGNDRSRSKEPPIMSDLMAIAR